MEQQQPSLGVCLSGHARLLRKRRMGGISFWTVRFNQKLIQLILVADVLEAYDTLAKTPAGSSVQFEGVTCLSKSGEFSVRCTEVKVTALCQRLLPSKHEGMSSGKRYNDRLTGLLAEPDSFELFHRIALCTKEIRSFLWNEDFEEFSTGVLQQQWEGGAAEAFSTYCNATSREYTLSLTSELKLRKLQVAGFDNVFEISQSFRNEGMDAMHSPEFSLLEVYKLGASCEEMMGLLEIMLRTVVSRVFGSPQIPSGTRAIDLRTPFHRIAFYDACQKHLGLSREECTLDVLAERYPDQFVLGMGTFTWVFKVINKLLSPNFSRPTFVTDVPSGISPFVKTNASDPAVSERAALLIDGLDIADIYADESDPDIVRESMQRQFQDVGVIVNEEYLRTLEYGLPSSGSIGMGLNRFFMLMRGALPKNIKETILFPL
jgi:lysyl-tRNA synthetase class 2